MAPVQSAAPRTLSYGGPRELTAMLDGIAEIVREEHQDQWDDADLRAASDALADHLRWRVREHARTRTRGGGT